MLMLLLAGLSSEPVERTWGKPEAFCTLSDLALDESSGIAASRTKSGEFFAHNDSGDSARFFKFTKAGKVTGIYELDGVKAYDWEDMAGATIGKKNFLYLADVGDNARVRKSVFVYRVLEPNGPSGKIESVETFELVYPDRARDCEAIFVDGSSGDIYMVSKARDQVTNVYRAKNPKAKTKSKMEFLKTLEIRSPGLGGNLVTGADVSRDGKFVVIRTYTGAFEYSVPKRFSDWVLGEPQAISLPVEKQGEAICYSLDGQSLLTSSEGSPCVVSRVPLISR